MKYFPVVPESKKPAVRWSDPSTWIDGPPEDGVWHAIPCGQNNGIFVVDLDVREDRNGVISLAEAFPEGLPDTRTVQTKHGFHLYYAYPPAGLRGRIAMLPGVDVKSEGGYVIGPGTPGYRLHADVPIAEAPEALLAMIRRENEAQAGESAIAISPDHPDFQWRGEKAMAFLESEPPCISGQGGDQQLLKVCLRLARTYEFPHEASLELLEPYNARCQPPWSREEMLRKLVYAAEKGTGPTGCAPQGFASAIVPVPIRTVTPDQWLPPRNPEHEYTFDSGVALHGGDHAQKLTAIDDRELGCAFIGPSAPPTWCGVFRWDDFRERIYAFNPPMRLDAEGARGLTDNDLTEIGFWLNCNSRGFTTIDKLHRTITAAAMQAKFHPIRDYLDALPKPSDVDARAWFADSAARLWGGNALESEMFKRQCIAAVRRVRQPGCKVDEMLILHGLQGLKKSQFLRKLFSAEFFLDQLPGDLGNKDAADALKGKWGVEVPEMTAAMSRKEENVRKGFLSRQDDTYRAPYGRTTETRQRQCVIFGSTNDDDIMTDPTGNRRYNIIHIEKEIDVDGFDRDQLWAYANVLEAAGDTHFFSREESAATDAHRQAYTATDPWADGVVAYVEKCRARGDTFLRSKEVLTKAIVIEEAKQTPADLTRVQRILRGYLKVGSTVVRDGEKTIRAYPL